MPTRLILKRHKAVVIGDFYSCVLFAVSHKAVAVLPFFDRVCIQACLSSRAPIWLVCCAAQETREHKRRQEESHNQEVLKYYGEQRNLDAAANSELKDDMRRREREARERQTEQNLIEGLYRVRLRSYRSSRTMMI